MKILVVEDDSVVREGVQFSLTHDGHEVLTAKTQREAMDVIEKNDGIDMFLLDFTLPDGDGLAICREIRRRGDAPVIFLTACDDEVHTVLALEQGADDYITKPFRIRELTARMNAVLRRTKSASASVIPLGEYSVNINAGKVCKGNEEIVLTAMEYKLLLILLTNRGQVLSRTQILNNIWDDAGDFVNDNTLTVYIKRLRQKLGDAETGALIKTVRGVGYCIEKEQS